MDESLMKIEQGEIQDIIAERYGVTQDGVCLCLDYEFIRVGDDKKRRDFIYAIIDKRPARKRTNADKIRAMTDEELASWISGLNQDDCPEGKEYTGKTCLGFPCEVCWLDWLRQEATG